MWDEESKNIVFNREEIKNKLDEIFESFSSLLDAQYICFGDLTSGNSIWSKEAVEYFGLPSERISETLAVWVESIREDYREEFQRKFDRLLNGAINVHKMTYRIRNKDGEYITCTSKIKLISEEPSEHKYFVGTIFNHSRNDFVDPITGLFGRKSLIRHMSTYKAEKKNFYLLITAIRNYFNINISYGYDFGNKVLGRVGEFALDMKRNIGKGIRVYRAEGSKVIFFIDAERYGEADVRAIFEAFKFKLKNDIVVEGHPISLDTCGAAVMSYIEGIDVHSIYTSAYYAIGRMKNDNSNELWFFNSNSVLDSKSNLNKLNSIRSSLFENFQGFYLCYQPIINVNNNKLAGMEALIRWKNDIYGVVSPSEFISWLENDTAFYELGNWILKTAINDAKELVDKRPNFIVNVNLAFPQLQREDFNKILYEIIKDSGLKPENLKLELTERCKIVDLETLKRKLVFFKSQGIKIAIDDFGTGYSALDLLIKVPVDQIKIDKSFIEDIESDRQKQSLMKAITDYAIGLGKEICVEGIETKDSLGFIKENFHPTFVQGYYYAKPMLIEEFKAWAETFE